MASESETLAPVAEAAEKVLELQRFGKQLWHSVPEWLKALKQHGLPRFACCQAKLLVCLGEEQEVFLLEGRWSRVSEENVCLVLS